MKNNTFVGQKGEKLALNYLKNKKHKILVKNFHSQFGEIDIITMFENNLYIYEVKYRQNLEYGFGEDSISNNKIKKILMTFDIWLSKNKIDYKNVYFNALIIDPNLKIHEFEIN